MHKKMINELNGGLRESILKNIKEVRYMPRQIEDPAITYAQRTGYPQGAQEKHCGTDWQGNEILVGDEIAFDPANDEEILIDNLDDYLIERLGFEFRTAE